MKKRILSLILVLIMVISFASAFCLTMDAATISYQYKPTVYIGGGGEYNIVWKTNVKSVGYVTYRYNGNAYTVYDEENGIVRTDDNIHTVRIPMEHLDAAKSYTVHTAEVVSRNGFDIKLGSSSEVSSSFRGYEGQEEIKFAFISDTHLTAANKQTMASAKNAVDNYMGGTKEVDMIVLNGDISNNMPNEEDFDLILEIANTVSEGIIPVLYVRGNHECRGAFAQKLYKYLVYDTAEFYCQFDFGPISCFVSDIGEDKEDDHEEYGGLNDMDHYLTEQLRWFEGQEGYSNDSTYHLAISHSPQLVDRFINEELGTIFSTMRTDVLICGHSHNSVFYNANYGNKNKLKFPVVHDGGHNNNQTMRTLMVTFSNDTYNFVALSDTGSEIFNESIIAQYKGSSAPKTETAVAEEVTTEIKTENKQTVTEDEDVVSYKIDNAIVPTSAGVSTSALKGAADTTNIITKPVVFDSGDYYNVVWQTTAGIECAGYVDITGTSGSLSYMDSFAGKLRTETTHSVKVPKEILNGSSYTIKSRVVTNYNMYGTVANPPTSYGAYTNGSTVKFAGSKTPKNQYNIVVIANANAGANTAASEINSSYTVSPDLIVSLGNVTGVLNTEEDFGKYLNFIAPIAANGKIPVLYLRGENEATGEFAANISNYIRTSTTELVNGKFYSNITLGDSISIIGLDTATTAPDSDKKYNGYANFDEIRADQDVWLDETIPNIFKNKCNIVFANADNLSNCVGVNFTDSFVRLETNLVVTGQSGKSAISIPDNNYAHVTCGSKTGDGSYGLLLTCSKDNIVVKKLGSTTIEIGTVNTKTNVAQEGGEDVIVDSTTPEDNKDDATKPDTPSDSTNKDDDKENDVNNNDDKETTDKDNSTTDKDDDNENDNTTSGDGEITGYAPGEFDGVSGDDYVREVPEGWYEDYLNEGFKVLSNPTTKGNGVITEGVFVQIVAKLAGINLSYYYDEDTTEDKASTWIEDCGIYNGYVGGEDVVSDNLVTTIVTSIFTIA